MVFGEQVHDYFNNGMRYYTSEEKKLKYSKRIKFNV